MNDVRKYIYSTLIILLLCIFAFFVMVFYNACGLTTTCLSGALPVERTPIPTLIPATLPAIDRGVSASAGEEVVRPSNPGGPGPAVDLTGDADAGKIIFDINCVVCHSAEGVGGVVNPGSESGMVPALNPVPAALKDADYKIFATNLDLFIEHGSVPKGKSPVFQMLAWGDQKTLTPQQIADVIAYIIGLNP